MKLSAHYNKASIIITISVLFAGAIIYFFAINYIAKSQLDHTLVEEIDGINNYIKLNHQLPEEVDFDEDRVTFIKTDKKTLERRFFDTVYNNPKEKTIEPGRGVSFLVVLKGEDYNTSIIVSRENTEYLVQIIGVITLILMVGLILILFLTNRFILNDLWRPFYATLNQIKAFNVSDAKNFHLKHSKVDEFSELNKAVHIMSSRIKNDFQYLKQFTENASHEMQTPLAVITSKLDTLIQDETLKEHYDQIKDIYAATNKLARLNQSLLLLVKIENNLIDDSELLRLDILIAEKIRQFQELTSGKNITVNTSLVNKEIFASKYLVDILLNNLFSNAIRHNIEQGSISIFLTADKLIVQNTGSAKPLNADTVFERFQKGNKSEGTGLGLTIVKNICKVHNWTVSYKGGNKLHAFQIVF